jgi:hypothetical protein
VSVLLGPVIGVVTGGSARVLLEVDKEAEVAIHVCRLDR